MDPTAAALARLRHFAQPMAADIPPADLALPAVRRLMAAAGAPYRIVDGVAVIHHGYLRTTEDVDILIEPQAQSAIDDQLAAHGFVRESSHRLRHQETGVGVHLLVAGEAMPRPAGSTYPRPEALESSRKDPAVTGLRGLIELKLLAGRHQDHADVVALLKPLSEEDYLQLEAAVAPDLRPRLWRLHRDALEEASWDADRP